MLESTFKREHFIQRLMSEYPNAHLINVDPTNNRSFPDLLMLDDHFWAAFETKRGRNASKRPNQGYYIRVLNELSFARFVYPENMEEVLDDLQRSFKL